MKINNLRVDKACSENWDNMSPNSEGRFCHLCSKTVIDFTQLTPTEISEKLKDSKANICAKLTKTQMMTPLLDGEKVKSYSLPYSKVAAGVMIAASLTSIQSCNEPPTKQNTELVSVHPTNAYNEFKQQLGNASELKARHVTLFKGKVVSKDTVPIRNAKVTFVTLSKMFSSYTDEKGQFSLELSNEVLDNDNVIRLSFDEIVRDENKRPSLKYYQTEDVILSKEEMAKNKVFYAEEDYLILGGIGVYESRSKNNPLVIVDGAQVPFKEFLKTRLGKKSSCNLENKSYYHFGSKAAMALCGDKAKFGLYLFLDESKL